MNNATLIQNLTKFANQDLAVARKTGAVCVAQTKLGSLEVQYEKGVYTVYALLTGMKLAEGPARVARETLIASYDVVQG